MVPYRHRTRRQSAKRQGLRFLYVQHGQSCSKRRVLENRRIADWSLQSCKVEPSYSSWAQAPPLPHLRGAGRACPARIGRTSRSRDSGWITIFHKNRQNGIATISSTIKFGCFAREKKTIRELINSSAMAVGATIGLITAPYQSTRVNRSRRPRITLFWLPPLL
jgi:hypothetical protein